MIEDIVVIYAFICTLNVDTAACNLKTLPLPPLTGVDWKPIQLAFGPA